MSGNSKKTAKKNKLQFYQLSNIKPLGLNPREEYVGNSTSNFNKTRNNSTITTNTEDPNLNPKSSIKPFPSDQYFFNNDKTTSTITTNPGDPNLNPNPLSIEGRPVRLHKRENRARLQKRRNPVPDLTSFNRGRPLTLPSDRNIIHETNPYHPFHPSIYSTHYNILH